MGHQQLDAAAPLRLRVRSRHACDSCRKRERKCNGSELCDECIGYGYECSFQLQPSKASPSDEVRLQLDRAVRKDIVAESSFSPVGFSDGDENLSGSDSTGLKPSITGYVADLPREGQENSILEPHKSRFVGGASSAIAFARGVGMDLGMTYPPRLHSYAWNTGIRPEPLSPMISGVRQLMSFNNSKPFFDAYFEAVNPLYGILNQDDFIQRCVAFWSLRGLRTEFEAVICGVISLGSLFSNGNPCTMESELVQHSKLLLESCISQPPALVSLDHVAAWILRSLYLRLTTRPHLSWLASCTTMHLAEATGLHQEIETIQFAVDGFPPPFKTQELDSRRRVFWVAWSLNRLLSAEYGRSPTCLDNVRCRKPCARKGDFTSDLIAAAELLPPCTSPGVNSANMLESGLVQLSNLPDIQAPFMLLKADVCLILCRRLWAKSIKLSSDQIDSILSILRKALVQARALSELHRPWWNVLSVPFQTVCLLLSINSDSSIGMLSEAIDTLKAVSLLYDTHLAREALDVAKILIGQSAERKRQHLAMLDGLCQSHVGSGVQLSESNDLSTHANLFEGLTSDGSGWTQFHSSEFL